MREFEFKISKALRTGLSPFTKTSRNAPVLLEAMNLRVGEGGLEPYEALVNPFPRSSIVWPFPQMITGKTHRLLVIRDELVQAYKIYKINSDWTVNLIFTADDQTFGSAGGLFEIADFGPWFLLSNGSVMLRVNTTTGNYVAMSQSTTIPLLRHICEFNGQIVGANVQSSWYGCDKGSIVWSAIGSANFTPNHSNVAGFRHTIKSTEAMKVLKLDKQGVIVYADNEIGVLQPVIEPAPTFGYDMILPLGIIGEKAVDGTEHVHVFVDKYGYVWKMNSGKEIKKLGYRNFIRLLDPEELKVTVNDMTGDFYICDSKRSFLLTEQGMTEVFQSPTSIGYLNGLNAAVFADNGRRDGLVVCNTMDMGFRAHKTIDVMEVGVGGDTNIKGAIRWKTDRTKDFASTHFVDADPGGVVYLTVEAADFQPVIRAEDYREFNLDYLILRWKMTDLRSVRTVYYPKQGDED